ncbi:MAG: tRNA pseudouridine(38-40) synthase TruA [Actinobacteria bacterium]|nr:tRNA pseudouridine(38-40) synthase TruA [Actinomycetota bacterium]
MDVAYDGTEFSGWARQPGVPTVQGVLEDALGRVLGHRGAEHSVEVTCAGRTDAGVHARGQVVHFDSSVAVPFRPLQYLNHLLPDSVRARSCVEVPQEFDARFSALSRCYQYRIADSVEAQDPLRSAFVLTRLRALDIDAMNRAARPLIGEHDFAAFCRRREGATTIREVLELDWRRTEDGLAVMTVVSDAFCHNMVRAITGALVAVGEGRLPQEYPGATLASGTRSSYAAVMPAKGLCLERVDYPAGVVELVRQAQRARRMRELP